MKKFFALLLALCLAMTMVASVASAEGYIRPEDQARLIAFRNNPSDESWIGK